MQENMPFRFNQRKTTQAVAFLLGLSRDRSANYMRLLKLLYIADRESLKETGRPITGDSFYAMKRGPVLSMLLRLIKGEVAESAEWSHYIERDRYHIRLVGNPGDGELCRYEEDKLREIWDRYQDCDEWDMVGKTHEFPEWQKNDPGDSSKPIPLTDVLEAVGEQGQLDRIVQDAYESNAFAGLFGN